MGLLNWLFRGKAQKEHHATAAGVSGVSMTSGDGWYVRPKIDDSGVGFPLEDKNIWMGDKILNVYRVDQGYSIENCPRCEIKLQRKYIGLIYASRGELRQSVSPCAYICDACSAAVIDESFPSDMASEQGYEYLFPVGCYSINRPTPKMEDLQIFKTYEGRQPIFVLDEDEHMEAVVFKGDVGAFYSGQTRIDRDRKRLKRKAQKTARKKNRRKH